MIDNRALVVICTRPESSRLPRKVFRRIAGVPAIEHILERLRTRIPSEHKRRFPVVLAVPDGCHDYDHLINTFGVEVFEGNAESPLHRMQEAVMAYVNLEAESDEPDHIMPKYVIRITHDDILIDIDTVFDLVDTMEKEGAGYGITPKIVEGAGVEVIHIANLTEAATRTAGQNIEHVSYFVKGPTLPNPDILRMEPRATISRPYRLTMDYPEDAAVLEAVLRQTGPFASCDDICSFIDMNPSVMKHNEPPLVSVYICAKNAEQWIQDTVRSVPDICAGGRVELIVVDDGSTDKTLIKILEVGEHIDKIIVNENNLGLGSSSNIGLKNCRGRYVMRLDADDLLKPGGLDVMVGVLKVEQAAVVYSSFDEMNDTRGVITKKAVDPRIEHHAGCSMMDAKMINELKFREGLRHWDGLELFHRLSAAMMPVAYFDTPLWIYRRHPGSTSAVMTPERKETLGQIFKSDAERKRFIAEHVKTSSEVEK